MPLIFVKAIVFFKLFEAVSFLIFFKFSEFRFEIICIYEFLFSRLIGVQVIYK